MGASKKKAATKAAVAKSEVDYDTKLRQLVTAVCRHHIKEAGDEVSIKKTEIPDLVESIMVTLGDPVLDLVENVVEREILDFMDVGDDEEEESDAAEEEEE